MYRLLLLAVLLQTVIARASANDEITKLIDQLVEVAEPGIGYSGYFSGSEFLPYSDTQQMATFVFGATQRSRSNTLQQIVAKGVDAVPQLLEHLSDDRKIKMEKLSGMMWMDFSDEYDFNRKTRKKKPEGVNRDGFGEEKHPDSHSVTVGDLCFVALGQIVNRNFTATRYQPTGGLIVNSPTYSKRLRKVILEDWKGLTAEKHKQLLIDDFKNPDYEDRRSNAYLRLSFYYPESVEALVLEELAKPTFDVFKIETLCRDKLYKTADPTKRKQLFDQFVSEHGDAYKPGIEQQLFDDLDMLEAHEERRISPPLTIFSTQPRELLIQLFAKPDNVKSSDRPYLETASASERARFIEAMTHDKSKRIGDVVRKIFEANLEDDYLAPACLLCLANRDFGSFLVEVLEKIDYSQTATNFLHFKYLRAISSSEDKVVQAKLLDVFNTTKNDEYFIEAMAGLGEVDNAVLISRATNVLDGLPDNTQQGKRLLALVADRFPDSANEIFKRFLQPNKVERAETACVVLWHGNPLAKTVLAPLLSDARILAGFTKPTRVCDLAAQAISHTTEEIKFDTEWSEAAKDAAIAELKKYCEESMQ
ncbi:hypothetical protein N9Y42_05070 [Mariniblastus sp.]|nr:hypothetical protein [Mariniblastus sp.]